MKPRTINIIADIAGRFDELMLLLDKMPPADLVLSVGDMIDRGPKSRQVVEWFMAEPSKREAVHANHEAMCLDAHYNYDEPFQHPYWLHNGGWECLNSFDSLAVPSEHLGWMASRPMWYRGEGLFVSHAPVGNVYKIPAKHASWRRFIPNDAIGESGWPWNRYIDSRPVPGLYAVYGHNSRPRSHVAPGATEPYAECIDNSGAKKLRGMHWPTREIFDVDYLP